MIESYNFNKNHNKEDNIINNILTTLDNLYSFFQENEDCLPLLMRLTSNPKKRTKMYYLSIKSIFDVNGKHNIIGVCGEDSLIIKIDDSIDLDAIKHNISMMDDKKHRDILSITNFEKFIPQIVNDLISKNVKVKLVNYLDDELNKRSKKFFEESCNKIGASFLYLDYCDELILYRISNVTENILYIISNMVNVFSIEQMPYIVQQ